jgi:hypothetical protein
MLFTAKNLGQVGKIGLVTFMLSSNADARDVSVKLSRSMNSWMTDISSQTVVAENTTASFGIGLGSNALELKGGMGRKLPLYSKLYGIARAGIGLGRYATSSVTHNYGLGEISLGGALEVTNKIFVEAGALQRITSTRNLNDFSPYVGVSMNL